MQGASYSKFTAGAKLQGHWAGCIFSSLCGNMLFRMSGCLGLDVFHREDHTHPSLASSEPCELDLSFSLSVAARVIGRLISSRQHPLRHSLELSRGVEYVETDRCIYFGLVL